MGKLLEILNDVRRTQCVAVMAVVNTTPDSFFDGGKYLQKQDARARIDQVLDEGADIVDIGAESTRPGAQNIGAQEQIDRAGPAIEYAVSRGALVSVDTTLPEVARAALALGARIVNDVSCLALDDLARATREAEADLILMHSRGSMSAMKGFSHYDETAYDDIVRGVRREWHDAFVRAQAQGLCPDRIWFDPGLGFHKSAQQSLTLMSRLSELSDLGAGLVLGASRKSFLAKVDGAPAEQRLGASLAAALHGVQNGAKVVRVHDVRATRQALLAQQAFLDPLGEAPGQPQRAHQEQPQPHPTRAEKAKAHA